MPVNASLGSIWISIFASLLLIVAYKNSQVKKKIGLVGIVWLFRQKEKPRKEVNPCGVVGYF